MACPASAVLKQHREKSPYARAAAERGSACHKYLEDIGSGIPKETAILNVPDDFREWCCGIDTGAVVIPNGLPETAYLYDASDYSPGARCLGNNSSRGRAYGAIDDYSIPGTADLVARADDKLCVVDYKTGKNVTPVRESAQMEFLALCAMLAHNEERCLARIVKIEPDSSHSIDEEMFTLDGLKGFADGLKKMCEEIVELKQRGVLWMDVGKGKHCKYCESKKACKKLGE
jgi:hypothetical protein